MSTATGLSADDFWALLKQSSPAPAWPRHFDTIWPDPRPERAGVEHPVLVDVFDVEGKIPRVDGGEEPWLELRDLRLAIRARDYDKYKFELLVVPIPRELYEVVRSFDDDAVDELIMAWTGGGLFVAFRIVRLCLGQVGSPVQRVIDWFPDGQPGESHYQAPAGHEVTPADKALADRARMMFGQLVNNMTPRGAPQGNDNRRRYSAANPEELPKQITPDLKQALDGTILELLRKGIHHSNIPSRIKVATIARNWPGGIYRETLARYFEETSFDIETNARRRLPRVLELNAALDMDAPKPTS